jgi:hypothetical protein
MQKTESARKLVLNKDTLSNLITVGGTTIQQQVVTSCGEPCCQQTDGGTDF